MVVKNIKEEIVIIEMSLHVSFICHLWITVNHLYCEDALVLLKGITSLASQGHDTRLEILPVTGPTITSTSH